MTRPEADGGSAPHDRGARDLLDEQRRAAAVASRRREHDLRREAEQSGTFAGVLVDLGERELSVAVSTRSGRTLHGVVRTIGADFIGLRSASGEGTLVRLAAVTAVRSEPGGERSVGDRVVHVDGSLVTVLADLASERPFVALHTTDGRRLAGELRATGRDVLTLTSPGDAGTTYVPVEALCDLVLP